jgi:hypothetical protein
VGEFAQSGHPACINVLGQTNVAARNEQRALIVLHQQLTEYSKASDERKFKSLRIKKFKIRRSRYFKSRQSKNLKIPRSKNLKIRRSRNLKSLRSKNLKSHRKKN